MSLIFLCRTSDIQENSSKGFSVHGNADVQDVFLVRRDDQFYAYKNSCPHTGVTLNWQDDMFMDMDDFYIQCSIHGARFQVEDGLCVWGPCARQSLTTMPIRIENEQIFLETE